MLSLYNSCSLYNKEEEDMDTMDVLGKPRHAGGYGFFTKTQFTIKEL